MKQSSGFSLLELSVVIVIIALLAGGIVVGKSLTRNAALRTVLEDVEAYTSATRTFRDKYWELPGDFTQATNFWGAASTTSDAVCHQTQGTGTQTCNGNGDGNINLNANATGTYQGEWFRFWQQLALAGMIQGTYTGIDGNTSTWTGLHIPGQNTPEGEITGTGFTATTWRLPTGTASYYLGYKGGTFIYGLGTTSGITQSVALTASEAYSLDKKVDDGKSGQGDVVTPKMTPFPNCTTTDNELTAEYNTSSSGKACPLHFRNRF